MELLIPMATDRLQVERVGRACRTADIPPPEDIDSCYARRSELVRRWAEYYRPPPEDNSHTASGFTD
jgi:hypothetical protein